MIEREGRPPEPDPDYAAYEETLSLMRKREEAGAHPVDIMVSVMGALATQFGFSCRVLQIEPDIARAGWQFMLQSGNAMIEEMLRRKEHAGNGNAAPDA